ncbi:hypothetical protein [Roseomonas genomospecies 6]|uniref:Uncharacterized protein n=1 Tax=Roseomonas genomospecies 6 TaxID=214106 RepID=A0A9W7NGR3_9PROT|nr:hypothetical protein [Roseomonas genomospecies 6]KAA0677691.1 hypothetical protein DS843_22900 [Roseomonas genomospecies 6]
MQMIDPSIFVRPARRTPFHDRLDKLYGEALGRAFSDAELDDMCDLLMTIYRMHEAEGTLVH